MKATFNANPHMSPQAFAELEQHLFYYDGLHVSAVVWFYCSIAVSVWRTSRECNTAVQALWGPWPPWPYIRTTLKGVGPLGPWLTRELQWYHKQQRIACTPAHA